MKPHSFGSLFYFLICCLYLGIFNIIFNTSLKNPGILKHHTEKLMYSRPLKFAYRCSVYYNLSFIKLVKLHKKIDKGSLTCSCRTYYGYFLTRLHISRKILYYYFIRIVSKFYILKAYISLYIFYMLFLAFFTLHLRL